MEHEKKLKKLENSLNEGLVTKEEFEHQKKELMKEEQEKPPKESPAKDDSAAEEPKAGSEKVLLWTMFAVVAVVAAFIVVFLFFKSATTERPSTIEELHALNMQERLDEEQGYLYNGYSFVRVDDLWYTEIQNPSGTQVYSIPLHYGPNELEDILLAGTLDDELFNREENYFITFDPLSDHLQYTALAVGEFDQNIIQTLGKIPVAACRENKTVACATRPIITCDNTDKPVVYFRQRPPTQVVYDGNCVIIQGTGQEILRATDRFLFGLYGIMEPKNV